MAKDTMGRRQPRPAGVPPWEGAWLLLAALALVAILVVISALITGRLPL